MTSWFSNQGSVLIALNQEVKSCFHVRHVASTYTFGEDVNNNDKKQDQQKQQLQLKSCFHVRHDAFTYTFWVRLNCHGSKQWYQREGHKILKRLTTAQRDTVAGEMFARLVDSKTTRTPELRAWHSPDSKQSTCSRLVGLGEGGDDVCSTLMMRH